MKKTILISALVGSLFTFSFSFAANNLWEYFKGDLPSLDERAVVYNTAGFEGDYRGTPSQNRDLLSYLQGDVQLGFLAPPSSTVEGTSTAGWTDDGSNVRLNTSSDFVGVGTANPAEKLSVAGGNISISGDAIISGGDIQFGSSNGSGTTTLSSVSSRFGIGTTSPTETLSVGGNAFISGTTTTGVLRATSSIAFDTDVLRVPPVNTASSTCIARNGTNQMFWIGCSSSNDWEQLGETVTASASSTITVANLATRQDLMIKVESTGISTDSNPLLRFNGSDQNYGGKSFLDNSTTLSTNAASTTEINLTVSTTTGFYTEIKIGNPLNRTKQVFWEGTLRAVGSIPPQRFNGSAVWNNNSQITSVSLLLNGGPTFTSPTRVTVWAKKD